MCSVIFFPRPTGYILGMNRDEKRARAAALPPRRWTLGGRTVIAPSEPGGGMWIGLNDNGATLALINWYAISARVTGENISRGEVTKAALSATTSQAVEASLHSLTLARVNPFRLISLFPQRHEVLEWRWDLRCLQRVRHPWQPGIWISSGYDEPGAQSHRAATFAAACRQVSCGSLDGLRRLHRSHRPECGPYSICMHRANAATVSHTEILVTGRAATLRYIPGAPCLADFTALTPHRLRVRPGS
jgi:hypothetical protein